MAQQQATTSLAPMLDTTVCVITNDGRNLVGMLRGYDQTNNIVLEECHERVYSTKAGVELEPLGLYMVRGDNVAVVGEIDDEVDSKIDFNALRAPPLKPIRH
uniref:U6 snRNA-associated Sm-like protein LSm8 n=1 Tax=Chlamydomonas euryale TaxID=1486919 RepID=A0A7R9VU33_9CHLO|mmetsp:Transcript_43725/g.131066  ORF Transcript_43725/g.131066 Transcript_43725/m.131066 type:complete len:102 (+) Transcript_43725:269-574(+)